MNRIDWTKMLELLLSILITSVSVVAIFTFYVLPRLQSKIVHAVKLQLQREQADQLSSTLLAKMKSLIAAEVQTRHTKSADLWNEALEAHVSNMVQTTANNLVDRFQEFLSTWIENMS